MEKFMWSVAGILFAGILVLVMGSDSGWWEVSSNAEGLVGLVAIVPAVIWIFFKGVNIINCGMYIGGIDYILIKKFLSLGQSVALIVIEAVIIIAVLCIMCAKKNKELENAGSSEDKEKEAIGG